MTADLESTGSKSYASWFAPPFEVLPSAPLVNGADISDPLASCSLILQCDAVLFVLSSDAVASEICGKEVTFAQSLNKRSAKVSLRGTVRWKRKFSPSIPDTFP
jgi:hypothetical protein